MAYVRLRASKASDPSVLIVDHMSGQPTINPISRIDITNPASSANGQTIDTTAMPKSPRATSPSAATGRVNRNTPNSGNSEP